MRKKEEKWKTEENHSRNREISEENEKHEKGKMNELAKRRG